jgi:hypothetical protein
MLQFARQGFGQTGARATAETQIDPYFLAVQELADYVRRERARQVIRRFVEVNFGQEAAETRTPLLTVSKIQARSICSSSRRRSRCSTRPGSRSTTAASRTTSASCSGSSSSPRWPRRRGSRRAARRRAPRRRPRRGDARRRRERAPRRRRRRPEHRAGASAPTLRTASIRSGSTSPGDARAARAAVRARVAEAHAELRRAGYNTARALEAAKPKHDRLGRSRQARVAAERVLDEADRRSRPCPVQLETTHHGAVGGKRSRTRS